MPLDWNQLTPQLDPAQFNLRSAATFVARRDQDPWADPATLRQRLPD